MTNIKAGIKFRPLLADEANIELQWTVEGKRIKSANGKHNLTFDNVFDEEASIRKVYKALARPIVEKALEGFNGTIFAYGQTSSGKTYSMIGDGEVSGIIPLAVKDIFKRIELNRNENFEISIGYVEIYNDKLYDLFDNRKTGLKIFESNGNVIFNQKEFTIESEEEVLKHFQEGNKCKRMVETATNERSSRSHSIFRITIQSHGEDGPKMANLFLVDLAGSEKPDPAKSTFSEGLHINKSLLTLGIIFRELSKKNSNLKRINFRQCKLTRILSPALGGDSLTLVICTVSPTACDETYRTICFAQDAIKAKTYPTFNSASKAMKFKKVRFEEPIVVSSLNGVNTRRRKVTTPIGSKLDLRRPVKKIKTGESRKVTVKKASFTASLRVGQSLKYDSSKNKVSVQKFAVINQSISNSQETFTIYEDEEDKTLIQRDEDEKALQQKNEEIKALEEQLTKTRNQLFKNCNKFNQQLQGKMDAIETMEKMHDEQRQADKQEIASLKEAIKLYEVSAFEKETEIRKMQSKFNIAREGLTESKKKFQQKDKTHKQFIAKKDEQTKGLEMQLKSQDSKMRDNKVKELRGYLKLEKHFETKLREAQHTFEGVKKTMEVKFEGTLRQQEKRLKKIINEKDEEIKKLKAASTIADQVMKLRSSKRTSPHERLGKVINF